MRWRAALSAGVPVVLLAGMLPVPPAVAEDTPAKSMPTGSMDSARWHWAQRTPNGDRFEQYAPLIEVNLGPGGASVWAGTWTVPKDGAGPLMLKLSGLPIGIDVAKATLPMSVPKGERAPATSCRRVGTEALCAIKAPSGSQGSTAVTLRAGKNLKAGRTAVTATLLRNGVAVPKADEEFFLVAGKRTPSEFYVTREGQGIVTAGQPQVHKIAVYRMSGQGRFRIRNLVPERLRQDLFVKGRGWQCRASRCDLRQQIRVGERARPLGMLWRVENADVRAWPKVKGAKAHAALWWTRYSGGRLRQDTSLVAVKQDRQATKKPKSVAQILAPSRRAMLTTEVEQHGPARIGGDGRYQVRVVNGGSRPAKAVRVALKPPAHARITRIAHNDRWRCDVNACRWSGVARPKKTLPPLMVLLRSRGKVRSKQPFAAVASWSSKGRRAQDRGVDRSIWLNPLRVTASATNRVVHSESGINTQLMAQISNAEGSQVHYRWKQTGGPGVAWVGKRSGSVRGDTASARFTPPKVLKPTALRFQVTVTGGGATTRQRLKVTALPSGDTTAWDPRRATTVPPSPAQASERLNRKPDPRAAFKPVTAADARINGSGVTITRPGAREVLRLRLLKLRKAEVRKVSWRVDGRKVDVRGRKLPLRISAKQRGPMHVVARIHLDKGRQVDVGEVLDVRRKATKSGARLSATPITLCQAFALNENDTFTIGGLTLTASAVTPNGVCTDSGASVAVTAADFVVDGATVSGLTLTMTSAGITGSVTSVTLPGASSVSVSGTLSATWTGSFSGNLTATGLFPYLPLPGGWAGSSATISFSGADLSLSATATGPNDGQAVLSGDLNSDGSFSLSLAVQNAVQIAGYDGSSAMFGGSGSIARASGGGMTYDVALAMSTSGLEILDNVTLGAASLDWNNSGLNLAGTVTTTIGSDSVVFSASAEITNATDWTATISSTATPSVASLPLASLTGTFTYNSALTFDVTATVSNVEVSSFLGLDITTASASIQNDGSDLELALAVAGSVNLFSDTIDVNTTVDVDITTGTFDADFSLAGSGFGPAEAQLTAVNFFVANDGAADPALANNPCAPSGSGTVYGFTATATILSEASFQVTGVYQGGTASNPAGSGYCFYGQVASSDISELSSVNVGDSLNFLYATYATTAAGQSIPATSPTMWANMTLPSQVQTYLNNDVTGFTVLVELVTTGGKVTGLTINGDVDMSAYVAGSATSLPSFELTSIGISLELTLGASTGVEVSFDSDGVLTTPGNSAGSMTQSTMNFDASIGLQLGSSNGGGSLNLTANLSSNAPVTNAFGVGGLTLQQLGVSAVIGFDALLNSSITFSATNLELPSNVSDAIGLSSTAPIDFSLTVGIVAPCFYISIGTPDQTTNAAIDWGGAGVLEAYYFKLLLAPFGNCTESDGTKIDGNFAVDFTGYIFGVTVDIDGTVEIDPDFFADISATVGGFNLAGLDLNETVIDIDFNPSAGVFDLNFSGGANLWSAVIIDVSGTVDIDLSATKSSFDIQFDGSMDENLFGIFQSDVWVDLGVDAGINDGSFYLNELDVSIGGLVKILIFEANASFTLDYQNGGVQVLTGDFAVNINLYILQFGVSLAFQYDPAVTGNQDLAITISGYVDIDLWLFNIRASVSITIDVDASFLGGSEYHPQPVQQVNAPASLASASPNTNPNTWNWNSAMYQGNNFGWLANMSGNYTAIYAAALAFESNGLEQTGPPGYYPSAGSGQNPNPGDVSWIMSELWPGAYTTNQTSNAFSVVPTKGTATIGETTAATDTYSELEVTATLPPSPIAGWWSSTIYEAQARGVSNTFIPSTTCMTQNTTETWNVQIPTVPNASPDNWAWVMLDTNWRMFGSTLREVQNVVYQGFAGSSYNDPVEYTLSDLTSQYSWYDAPVPLPFTQALLTTGDNYPAFFDCGYDDFTEQTSLYDFMAELNIPWENAAPPTYQPDMGYTTASTYNVQPGWGAGWNPYDLEDTQFTAQQAFNVQVSPQSMTCQAGSGLSAVQIQDVWWPANQLWSDPTNGWVPITSGEYLELEENGVEWNLHLYNSSGQELTWNGSEWSTEPNPEGGYFAIDGQLIGGDRNGVLYQSAYGHVTYLAFQSDNPIMAQVRAGVGDPSYTYQPTASLNECQNGVPLYTNPNTTQGQAPASVPTWQSITTNTYTASQVYQVSSPFSSEGCYAPNYLPLSGTSSAQTPITGAAGPAVDLATTGWSLRLDPIANGQTTVRLYNLANQEVRWFNGGWNTQPSGGWPSGAVAFAGDPSSGLATLYSASVTGVWVSYGSRYLYLWFSADNVVTDASDFLTGWYYEPDLNTCTNGVATYSGT